MPCRVFSERRRAHPWCWIDTGLPDIFRVGARRRGLIWNRSLCRQSGARIEIRTDVEKRLKVAAITGFTAGEMEGNWQATEVGLQVNLGRETATRAAKRSSCCPLLRPLPRHGRAPRWNRTSAPNAPSRSSPPGHRRTLRKFQIGSAARTASTRCSSARISPEEPAK